MLSTWWVLAAFLTGAWTGVLLMALMHMSGRSQDESVQGGLDGCLLDRTG